VVNYYNSKYLTDNDITIPFKSYGFQYGYGVFTSLRTAQGEIPFLDEHLNRLKQQTKKLHIEFPNLNYREIITQLIARNSNSDLRLKISLFIDENLQTNTLITAMPFIENNTPKEIIIIPQHYSKSFTREIKTLNYLENVFWANQVKKTSFNDGLFLNEKSFICECCYSNIFFQKDNKLYTPKADGNILNGIIRQQIIKMFPVIEKDLHKDELGLFEKAFTTNAVQGITIIKNIEDILFNTEPISTLNKWENGIYK